MLLERHVCVATCVSDSLSDLNESSEGMIWTKDLVFPVAAVAAVCMFVRSAHLGGIPLGLLLFKVHVVLGLGITCQTQAVCIQQFDFLWQSCAGISRSWCWCSRHCRRCFQQHHGGTPCTCKKQVKECHLQVCCEVMNGMR